MPYIQWRKEFDLGIDEFDEHHKHLVNLLNKTFDGFTSGENRNSLGDILDELIDYATFHFAAEEYWMKKHEYPELTEHSEEHNRFSRRVVEIQKDFHTGKTELSLEVLQFLNNWLVDHILKTDAIYALFAKELSCP